MKRTLVIGGTQSFGKEISLTYVCCGHSVDVIGRSNIRNSNYTAYLLDLLDVRKRRETFTQLITENKYSDIVCVVGYARSQAESDFRKSRELNIEYVRDVFSLCSHLKRTQNIITIGSQWSLQDNFAPLQDYILAKHELRQMTIDFARSHSIRANHYCVPTMYTTQLNDVLASFERTGIQLKPATNQIHTPKDIAETLVDFDLKYRPTARTFFVREPNVVEQIP